MENYWFVLILAFVFLSIILQWYFQKDKDFSNIIKSKLEKENLRLLSLKSPNLFDVGPFKKVEISIKPQINNGAVQYEKTYYRIIELQTKSDVKKEVWAKIDTSWFSETKIEFSPKLSTFK